MALTFDDAYRMVRHQGKEIGQLAKRGDALAKDVFIRYSAWFKTYTEGHDRVNSDERNSFVKAFETYLQRDLVVHEREHLKGAKGHLVEAEADPTVPTNLVEMSVARALRDRR